MNYNRVAIAKGLVDLAYTAAILGVVAYTMRDALRTAYRAKRAELDAMRIEDAARKSRRGFLSYLRERGIEPRGDELGLEP